jgi:hypothetical protein
MLTREELAALDKLDEATHALRALPTCHPSDWPELVPHIHALQAFVMARSAVREHPGIFVHEEGFR